MAEFYELVELKYKEITDEQKDPEIIIEREENLNTDMKIANVNEFFYKNPITKQSNDKIGIIGEQLNINDSVKVLKRITMSDQTESYQLANNWYVKINALKPYATVKNTVAINRPMKVIKNYYLYNKPYNTVGSKRQATLFSRFKEGSTVKVKQKITTSENINVYLLDNGQYVDHRALEEFATVKQTQNINRPMKVIKNYYLYNKPYNTVGSKRQATLFSRFKEGSTVKVKQKITTSENINVYLLDNGQYVDHRALKEFATVKQTQNINRPMKVIKNYYLYNKPYNTVGSKRQATLFSRFKEGSTVKVKQKITTSENINVYLLDNGQYVDHRALEEFATVKQTQNINRPMKVIKNYYLYNKPYNTVGSKRQATLFSRFKEGSTVKVKQKITTSENINVYLLDNGQYVDHRALKEFDSIKQTIPVNSTMRIKDNGYFVYNNPYGTAHFKRLFQMKSRFKLNDEVYVTNKLVTSAGITVYHINGIGYVDHRALKNNATIKTETSENLNWRIVDSGYNVYSQPYGTQGSKIIQPLQRYFDNVSRNVTITKKVITSDNITTFYVKGLGWIDHRAVAPHTTIVKELNLNLSQVIINDGYYIYSHPYGTAGYERVEKLSSYVKRHGNNVTVIKEVTTSGGTNVVQLKGIGWVDKRAVADGQAYKMKQVQNLLNRKYNQYRFGIHVISLTDGATASVNPNKSYTAASTGKLPAIYYTQKRLNNGELKSNQSFLYHDRINQMSGYSYQRGGAGILQSKPYGSYYTIDNILKWTIEYSDNQGANFLGYYGANQFNSAMRKEISQIIGRTWQSPFTITAKENAQLMRAIYYQGGSANKYLQNTVYDNQRIPKYLPVKVGHKIGDVYDYRHDVAIVYAKQPYVLSVMTSNYTSYETISLMSKEIYDILK
ncbi:serine hydrolase [Vagococcus lutrae]|uniref:serine hydrolase n=1 Tax=Vagococcus lutrae TaxID=81947 RepID=UPI00232EBC4C|nr:serine hydrolase [Vagococcus lutrae]MDT2843124.1 serine hydrolase [Vagococcus lutrae]WCG05605.1 serine hydrolase [Vagococcus lutrae]